MSRPRAVGDNPNYVADADTGFDGEGYLLAPGSDSGESVTKTGAVGDAFVGVNHHSTYNEDDTEVRTGEPIAVIQEGPAMVLCEEGTDYTLGDAVYVSATAGVASTDSATDTATRVGTVVRQNDLTGAAGPGLVQVNITGSV